MTLYKLSPSDLTFLWDECKRCFYLKVVQKFNRPATPMPSIFTRIDGLMKTFFEGKSTIDYVPELPPGIIQPGDKSVYSTPITLPGRLAQCYITGRLDTLVNFADGSYGVVDFKTSTPKPEHIEFYGRQLHAYMYALENPAPGKFGLSPISRLGLLVVEPNAIDRAADGRIAYLGGMTYQAIPRSDERFLAFLGEIMEVLESPLLPPAGDKCPYCQYRQAARDSGV